MNPPLEPETIDSGLMTRREALRRTALGLGLALTPSLLTGVMHAQAAARSGASTPVYLSPKLFETAGAIAERFIPKTDTPGARDAGVPAFLDLMYGKYMTPKEKAVFAEGLADVDQASTTLGQRSFSQLSPERQDGLLKKIGDAAQAGLLQKVVIDSQGDEKTFFHLIKELTLLGFFMSEQIGKHVLHYDPIPGRYDGCIPLSEVGNVSWTR